MKRKPLPSKHPIDRAVNTMLRALDKRLACASGMPWYENDAKRVNAIRKALLAIDAVPYGTKNVTARQVALSMQPYTGEEALQKLADSLQGKRTNKPPYCGKTIGMLQIEDLEQGR
jgi:hypothetical protein